MEPEEKILYWLWFSLALGPANRFALSLYELFDRNIDDLFHDDGSRYAPLLGKDRAEYQRLCDKNLKEAGEIRAFCMNEGIGILTPDSPMYPGRLRLLDDMPVVLYYRGALRNLDPELCIAAVGTRHMSEKGAASAYTIAYDLALAGAVVVSGMAKGIDGMCHRGALDAGGYTIAVLGCGIDRVYPAEHLGLMRDIIRQGLVVTEYKPFTPPNGFNFPKRNRIISGICQGTLVVEAPVGSGSIITARTAKAQGRDVYALPGDVSDSGSVGVNGLIRDNGARLITDAGDILAEYQPLYHQKVDSGKITTGKDRHADLLGVRKFLRNTFRKKDDNGKKGNTSAEEPVLISEKKEAVQRETDRPETEMQEAVTASAPSGPVRSNAALTPEQKKIFDAFGEGESLTCDMLCARLGMGADTLLPDLTVLEINDCITALPGGFFRIKN